MVAKKIDSVTTDDESTDSVNTGVLISEDVLNEVDKKMLELQTSGDNRWDRSTSRSEITERLYLKWINGKVEL